MLQNLGVLFPGITLVPKTGGKTALEKVFRGPLRGVLFGIAAAAAAAAAFI